MMVTTQGEDYMVFAHAKGLKGSTLFMKYAVRNACCRRRGARAGTGQHPLRRGPGRGDLRLPRHRDDAVPRDPRERLLLIQGIVIEIIASIGVAEYLLDPDLPAHPRSAHHLQEELAAARRINAGNDVRLAGVGAGLAISSRPERGRTARRTAPRP